MRRSASSRAAARVLALLAVAVLGGCSFLADEFGWLDRKPPRFVDANANAAERP